MFGDGYNSFEYVVDVGGVPCRVYCGDYGGGSDAVLECDMRDCKGVRNVILRGWKKRQFLSLAFISYYEVFLITTFNLQFPRNPRLRKKC